MNIRCTSIVAAWLLVVSAPTLAQNSFSEDIRKAPAQRATAPTMPAPVSPSQGTSSQQDSATIEPQTANPANPELKDFGIAPTDRLHEGPMHAPTPSSIPGALVVTTEALQMLLNREDSPLVFDVLGGPQMLPNAQNALPAGQGGSFSDSTQREFGNYLAQVTGGNKDMPLVFYCQSIECWMSYNAALRAVKLGYTQVLWYRGGIEAWQAAGRPVVQRQPW